MNLLLVLPYCEKDCSLLEKNLDWMTDLQPDYKPHSCLLVADSEVSNAIRHDLLNKARPLFEHTDSINVVIPKDKQTWPAAPNIMFASAARQVAECYRLPWLWFEPDATPIRTGWLDDIARAYQACPKRFMGSLIPSEGQENMPPLHLAGCAVYPPDAYEGLVPMLKDTKLAFDIVTANYSVPRAKYFLPMQHYWGSHDLAPEFRETVTPLDPKNILTLEFLKSDTLTFHRCKNGSLIDLLRQKQNSPVMATRPEQSQRPRAPARTAPRKAAT